MAWANTLEQHPIVDLFMVTVEGPEERTAQEVLEAHPAVMSVQEIYAE